MAKRDTDAEHPIDPLNLRIDACGRAAKRRAYFWREGHS